MNLLAIDTSTDIASVAVLVDGHLFSDEQDSPKTHAQLIIPMIDRLMISSGIQMNQLDGVIFGCGPGSFTGLRIACSVAKGLAYAHDLNLIPVSSLATIAWSAREQYAQDSAVMAVLDARMHELYWGYFAPGQLMSTEHVNAARALQIPTDQPIILAGLGIDTYWNDFPAAVKSQMSAQLTIYPKAEAMIQLARHADIKPVSVAKAQPVYVRNQVTQGDSRG